jgi:cobalamin biosynthesis protein CobD/CbiB
MFKLHLTGLLLGTILEYVFGRIYSVWNPMDSIKRLVEFLDRALLGDEIILLESSKQRGLGRWLIIITLVPVFAVSAFFTMLCFEIAPWLGVIFEAIATCFCLDYHRLYYGGLEVIADYSNDGIDATEKITYIANEASDSVMSPLFVMFLFGPVGGFLYKAIDIMDSVVGHQDIRYQYFGEPAARLNRIVDYIPSRFSGAVAVFAARHTFGGFNGKNARYIHLRDKYKSVSAFAGALDITLKEGAIGDADKMVEPVDIRKAVTLLRNCFLLCQLVLVILLLFF